MMWILPKAITLRKNVVTYKGGTTGFTAHTMLTCTSPQYITTLQLCTILHLLRITQRLL